jgi:hypothetical protein
MLPQTIAFLITAVLLVHGLGHGGAIGALIYIDRGATGGKWLPARSWLLPKLSPRFAKIIAITFWAFSMIGFIAATLSFWGILFPVDLWRSLALVFAIVSLTGIILFWGIWPMFNTLAAQLVNLAVIITQLWLHWPPLLLLEK